MKRSTKLKFVLTGFLIWFIFNLYIILDKINEKL